MLGHGFLGNGPLFLKCLWAAPEMGKVLVQGCSSPSVEVQVGPATLLVCTYASWHHQTVPLGLTLQQGFQSWIHSASQGTSEVPPNALQP